MTNLSKSLSTITLALTFGLAGCGGPEGTYKLDKAEMKKSIEADMAKLPENERIGPQFALKLLDAAELSVTLEPGGKLKAKATKPSLDASKPATTEEKTGTWKQEGDALLLEMGDGKPVRCARAANKLTCKDASKPGETSLFFVKG